MEEEIREMEEELRVERKVFLEDELGDIFWDYICLLESLSEEGKIDKNEVFRRCYMKFTERLTPDGKHSGDWNEVKKKQKERLMEEQDAVYP
jgi:NTP pyrophosphatase (non-canonical NTP hydrolase)